MAPECDAERQPIRTGMVTEVTLIIFTLINFRNLSPYYIGSSRTDEENICYAKVGGNVYSYNIQHIIWINVICQSDIVNSYMCQILDNDSDNPTVHCSFSSQTTRKQCLSQDDSVAISVAALGSLGQC